MLTEELGQIYQALAPVPPWFRYLVTYQEVDGNTGLTLGVLLALVYLIMKVTPTAATAVGSLPARLKLSACSLVLENIVSPCMDLQWFGFVVFAAFRIVQPADGHHQDCEDILQGRGTFENRLLLEPTILGVVLLGVHFSNPMLYTIILVLVLIQPFKVFSLCLYFVFVSPETCRP